jgi:hypothetical protein
MAHTISPYFFNLDKYHVIEGDQNMWSGLFGRPLAPLKMLLKKIQA